MKRVKVGMFMLVFLWGCVLCSHAAGVSAYELKCEHLESPVGIDMEHPRFSWVCHSDRRGFRQTAYRLLVATSPDKLKKGKAGQTVLLRPGELLADSAVAQWDNGCVPTNSDAVVWLPTADAAHITEHDVSLDAVDGIKAVETVGERTKVTIGSATYQFVVAMGV